jgi:hypothetical protein
VIDRIETGGTAFLDYYRCPAALARLTPAASPAKTSGYFRFGDAIGYGRCSGIRPVGHAADDLTDCLPCAAVGDEGVQLPFDLSEVVTNLRQERYRRNGYSFLERTTSSEASQRLYYLLRPLLGVGLRKHLQKVRLRGWENIAFPEWPVDFSVERLMENSMALLLQSYGGPIPFIWFWPQGATACAMMTHDVEGQVGAEFSEQLMDVDDTYGIKSAFQLIPEQQAVMIEVV